MKLGMIICEHCGYAPGLLKLALSPTKRVYYCKKCSGKLIYRTKTQQNKSMQNLAKMDKQSTRSGDQTMPTGPIVSRSGGQTMPTGSSVSREQSDLNMSNTPAQGERELSDMLDKALGTLQVDTKSTDKDQRGANNCTMAVNELLCFIQNNMSSMPFDLLHATCVSFFSEEEVKSAKEILSPYILDTPDHPLLKRFCASRSDKVMAEMINYMIQVSSRSLPDFLAKDLTRIPPVPMEKIDGASLFREMQKLHAELSNVKMRMSMADVHRGELAEQIDKIHARQFSDPKAPMPKSSTEKQPSRATYSSVVQRDDQSTVKTAGQVTPPSQKKSTDRVKPVKENILEETIEIDTKGEMREEEDEGFKLQGRPRKRRKNIIRGNGTELSLKCRPAPPSKIYVGNLAPETSIEEIVNHVKTVCKVDIQCEQLEAKFDTYSSFVLSCAREKRSEILKPECWPQRAIIRPYYAPKGKKQDKQDG